MKSNFRKEVLSKRLSLTQDTVTKKSIQITSNLLTLDCISKAKHIMVYLDFRNEVSTDLLIQELLHQNIHVSCPITDIKTRNLIPIEIHNLDKDICIGAYKIREPKSPSIPLPIERIDVVIVPLVAASFDGHRLGYGGGYYDRFLSKIRSDTITIGLAYEMQVFDTIPTEEHDVKLNYIVTENRILSLL